MKIHFLTLELPDIDPILMVASETYKDFVAYGRSLESDASGNGST